MTAMQACADHGAPAVSGPCRVAAVRHFGSFTLLSLVATGVAARARPGQFVMVAVPGHEFHLRRPLSVHSLRGDVVRLLVEPRGAGSRALCELEIGDVVEVAGPLGNAFPVADGPSLVLGGGIGAAPLQLLVDVLGERGLPTTVVFGFRDARQARMAAAFEIDELWVATEDGSVGRTGTVLDIVAGIDVPARSVVYACGPTAMLAAVGEWARQRDLAGYASLEAHMACGSGTCQGCVVATRDGYRRVCAEGPVFGFDELAGEPS